jgi:hypothetical protein
MASEKVYRTVDIERRGYGRRYTWLFVDQLTRQGFSIDCSGAYTRPDMFDIRPDDIVRWREGERLVEGRIVEVHRDPDALHAVVADVHPLPPDSFFP